MTPDPDGPENDHDLDAEAAAFFRPRYPEPTTTAQCPAPELLRAFRAGTLSPLLQARVAQHVAGCAMCGVLVEALEEMSPEPLTVGEQARILARVRKHIGPVRRGFGGLFTWQAMAAAAAAIVVGVVLWQFQRVATLPDASSALRLEKPAVRLPGPQSALEFKSKSAPVEALVTALEPYRADDLDEAARRLSSLVNRFPGDAFAHFYLGATHLLMANNASTTKNETRFGPAIAALETARSMAIDDSELTREAAWYLALAYHAAGQEQRASDTLELICREGGRRAPQACAALSELAEGSAATTNTTTEPASPSRPSRQVESRPQKPDSDDGIRLEQRLVEDTLRRYEAAYASLNADAVTSVHPTAPIEQLRQEFAGYRSYTLTIKVVRYDFFTAPPNWFAARLQAEVTHEIVSRSGESERFLRTQIIRLDMQGTNWVIRDIN
jgi:hypothetical protein